MSDKRQTKKIQIPSLKSMRGPVGKVDLLMRECLRIINDVQSYKAEDFLTQCFSALGEFNEALKEYSDENRIRQQFFDACDILDSSLMHYRMRHKPLGYAGDYLLIDWMYTKKTKPSGIGHHWDEVFHLYQGSRAVCNRKDMCEKVLRETASEKSYSFNVLNIGCGSCRDMYEAIDHLPRGEGEIGLLHCVDQDPEALIYAKSLMSGFQNKKQVVWECRNALRLRPEVKYDLIWSAGLFDYLNDRLVVFLLSRMWSWLKSGGRIVFGNFHPRNPSRFPMELCGQWFLIHRTEHDLMELVKTAGIPASNASVRSEPLGINLFCEIFK